MCETERKREHSQAGVLFPFNIKKLYIQIFSWIMLMARKNIVVDTFLAHFSLHGELNTNTYVLDDTMRQVHMTDYRMCKSAQKEKVFNCLLMIHDR